MRTIPSPAADYDLRVFLPTSHGFVHVYVKLKETIPDRPLRGRMGTKMQKQLLFPYLRTLKEIDPQIPVVVDTWEMLVTVARRR